MFQILNNQDIRAFDRLLKTHRDIATHLVKRSSEDQAYDVSVHLVSLCLYPDSLLVVSCRVRENCRLPCWDKN